LFRLSRKRCQRSTWLAGVVLMVPFVRPVRVQLQRTILHSGAEPEAD
jgi:hypothetical protein